MKYRDEILCTLASAQDLLRNMHECMDEMDGELMGSQLQLLYFALVGAEKLLETE